MMIKTGVVAHDNTCALAEAARQVAAKAAGSSQAAVTAADIAFYKAVRDSARANNLPEVGHFNRVLAQLGVAGS